jgi:GNAT superfamily N-acetyltransferase
MKTRELTPELWPDLEALFGDKGACGGCWCMYWRQEKGSDWSEAKGAVNKRRWKALVLGGKAHGVLAYSDGEAVGWCAFDKRTDLARLDRAPSLRCDDADEVWSLPCFYIKVGHRGRGVATALLAAALEAMKRRGVKIAEGYPTRPARDGGKIPAAFAYTGTRPLFIKAGFVPDGPQDGGRARVRLRVVR